MTPPLRIALVGAFPFPVPQGSQIYARDQARALASAGAEVALLCYGRGVGAAPAELDVVPLPRRLAPRRIRAGPSLAKPWVDVALLVHLMRIQRERRFEVVLAHNAEAGFVALAARAWTKIPVVYVTHTLLAHELSGYAPATFRRACDAIGRRLDRALAARADAVITLCREASQALAPVARRPPEEIPPGLDPGPAPGAATIERACRRYGLAAGHFALYTGNLDGYQDLGRVGEIARRIAPWPLMVASHDARGRQIPGVIVAEAKPPDAIRTLVPACGVALLPRRRPGGFPIKLLNYMEAARPIVAHPRVAEGLRHGESAWLLDDRSDAAAWATAIRHLLEHPGEAARLGAGARAQLERRHAGAELARRTVALARSVARPGAAPG